MLGGHTPLTAATRPILRLFGWSYVVVGGMTAGEGALWATCIESEEEVAYFCSHEQCTSVSSSLEVPFYPCWVEENARGYRGLPDTWGGAFSVTPLAPWSSPWFIHLQQADTFSVFTEGLSHISDKLSVLFFDTTTERLPVDWWDMTYRLRTTWISKFIAKKGRDPEGQIFFPPSLKRERVTSVIRTPLCMYWLINARSRTYLLSVSF
jgi:hypothetical protein